MNKIKIRVYSKVDNKEENNEFNAIKSDNVIKYIDLENNKMIIDIENNTIERENIDYYFKLDFNKNVIIIKVKKLHKEISKEIKTLTVSKSSKRFLVRYLLTDENVINEYYVNF